MRKTIELLNEELNTNALRQLVTEINNHGGALDYLRFYEMDMFDEYFYGMSPTDILGKTASDFNIFKEYFTYNDLGHIYSYTDYEVDEEVEVYRFEIIERAIEHHVDGYIDLNEYISAESGHIADALYDLQ